MLNWVCRHERCVCVWAHVWKCAFTEGVIGELNANMTACSGRAPWRNEERARADGEKREARAREWTQWLASARTHSHTGSLAPTQHTNKHTHVSWHTQKKSRTVPHKHTNTHETDASLCTSQRMHSRSISHLFSTSAFHTHTSTMLMNTHTHTNM